jgi:thiol-disulfide isomerase/thioredoxin
MAVFGRLRMPSLGGATGWLNSEPLGPAELGGRVVLVNFWTLTCINWLRQEPYVRAWSQAYRDDGLIVIGVHTPEFSFEHEIERVRQATKERAIDYPVALDNDYEIWSGLRQQCLAGALLRRRGWRHSRPPFRRRGLRGIGARHPAPSRRRARARRGRRARHGGGGRLGQPPDARDVSRLGA